MFLLYEGSEIRFVLYDLKQAIQEAMRLSLVLVRVRVAEDGSAKSMTIFSPS
jgi:hypothetical protein